MATKKPAPAKKVATATSDKPVKPAAKKATPAAKTAKAEIKAKAVPSKANPAEPRIGASVQARPPKTATVTTSSVLESLKQAMEEREQAPKPEPVKVPAEPLPWEEDQDSYRVPDQEQKRFEPDLRCRPDDRISLGTKPRSNYNGSKLILSLDEIGKRPRETRDVKFPFRK